MERRWRRTEMKILGLWKIVFGVFNDFNFGLEIIWIRSLMAWLRSWIRVGSSELSIAYYLIKKL